ncbi:MAG: glycosyltransferase [Cyclobacteriaceae bacterium]
MSTYLERYAWPSREFSDFSPHQSLDLIIVIPCYNEGDIDKTIRSLEVCENTENTLVIVIINESEEEYEGVLNSNQRTFDLLTNQSYKINLLFKTIKLPWKKAGVGLARKVGMDEAVKIFEELGKDGIIVCFDADCTCSANYLDEIRKYYADTNSNLGLIHYEHDLTGTNIDAIINYELFLRYYVNALRWSNFPFALQTLGSCITVKSKAYQKQGGMNTRKAGEDFYFIHKMIPLGNMGEINKACVYPSDRVSNRVPFGTGHAVQKYIDQDTEDYDVYNPRIFSELRHLLSTVEYLYESKDPYLMGYSPASLHFLKENDFEKAFLKMKDQSPTLKIFTARFYAWFDAFRVLKYVHFARDTYYPNIDIVDAIGWLNHNYMKIKKLDGTKENKLLAIREFDKSAEFYIK